MLSLTKSTLDVGLVPHDVEAMHAFYADVLGLHAAAPMHVPGTGTLRRYAVGDSTVKLVCPDEPVERSKGGMHHTIGYRLLTLVLPDLRPVLDRAEAAGYKVERVKSGGTATALVPDPDGNLLELIADPDAPPSLEVAMSVASPAATRAFYIETLGLREEPDRNIAGRTRHAALFGKTPVKWFEADDGAAAHTGSITAHAGIRYVTALVTSIDDTVAALTANGVAFPMTVTDIGIARAAIAADPDGSLVELVELTTTRRTTPIP